MKNYFLLYLVLSSCALFSQSSDLLLKFYAGKGIQMIAPNLISTDMGEYSPFFDINNNELFFMRRTPNKFDYTIYSSKLTLKGWSIPKIVSFSGKYRDAAPYLSPDGNKIYFDSKRPSKFVKENSINIWFSERKDSKWTEPQLVKSASINSIEENKDGLDEFGPAIDSDNNLYFYSFRKPFRGGSHYVVKGTKFDKITIAKNLPDPSYKTFVSYLYISPNGKFILLEGKGNTSTKTDIYYSCKNSKDEWIKPINLSNINTNFGEGVASLTADGKFLLFASDRKTNSKISSYSNLYIIETKGLFGKCQRSISN